MSARWDLTHNPLNKDRARVDAWQGPALGVPEPQWGWWEDFILGLTRLKELWTSTPSPLVSPSVRRKTWIQESQWPRWRHCDEDRSGRGGDQYGSIILPTDPREGSLFPFFRLGTEAQGWQHLPKVTQSRVKPDHGGSPCSEHCTRQLPRSTSDIVWSCF